jgi:hypothetical protein
MRTIGTRIERRDHAEAHRSRHVGCRRGGPRAGVHVKLRATNMQNSALSIGNTHIEVYSSRNGKISLERQGVTPDWTPDRGLWGGIF